MKNIDNTYHIASSNS